MLPNAKRAALIVAAALTAGAATTTAADAGPITRTCPAVKVGKGSAYGIRATGIGCAKARPVIKACLRRQAPAGWHVATAPSPDDTDPKGLKVLDKGTAHVVFQVRGRRACA